MSKYTPIIGTLGYVLSEDGKKVLMIHRNKRENDVHLGKYNGLGGKMERNECPFSSMKRELFEEAGIVPVEMTLKGTINWTGFGKHGEDWLGFIFLITKYKGKLKQSCDEGDLVWVNVKEINSLPMWEGDKHFLPLVFSGKEAPFSAFMPYKNDKALDFVQFSLR